MPGMNPSGANDTHTFHKDLSRLYLASDAGKRNTLDGIALLKQEHD
jgi:hypothetical protein